ncbi:hypothetical protein LBMAG18_12860 [Alphaproteobacteria bacterium]|nr:hypothetical protein LBMAG18_12860 [Alphaproteobacteria bacterium]
MEILSYEEIDSSSHGTLCRVYCVHAKVTKINECAQEMISIISDTSWINKLGPIPKKTFEATSARTISKLVNDILLKVVNEVTADFGEYLISHSAQLALERNSHTKFPLAELLKDRVSGNGGFDFHTESQTQHIMFGEAKYSATYTPKKEAIEQIERFVREKKDDAELLILNNFASETAMGKAVDGKKGYVAAFSLNGSDAKKIFQDALNSEVLKKLLVHQELYLIGIECHEN